MSKVVGHLKLHSGANGAQGYLGELTLHGCRGKIALKPNDDKRNDRSPDYVVLVAREGTAGWSEHGAGWNKTPKDKPTFISLLIDHESMAAPINVAAFPPFDAAKDDRWVILWGRPRGGKLTADAASALPPDEIPY